MEYVATLSDGKEYKIPDIFLFEPEEKFRKYLARPEKNAPRMLFNPKELDA